MIPPNAEAQAAAGAPQAVELTDFEKLLVGDLKIKTPEKQDAVQ